VNFHSDFTIFKESHQTIITQVLSLHLVTADVGNQLKVRPNTLVADDALMQHAHYACKMVSTSIRKTSEINKPMTTNRTTFQTSAATAAISLTSVNQK